MLNKELVKTKEIGESKLVLYEDFPMEAFIVFLFTSFVAILLYAVIIDISNILYDNASSFLKTISNDLDFSFLLITVLLLLMLVLLDISAILNLIIRKKIVITNSEVKIIYYLLILPFYRHNVRKYDLKLCTEKDQSIPKIRPIIDERDRVFFSYETQKMGIRHFYKRHSALEIKFLQLLNKHGIRLEEKLSEYTTPLDDQEDLTLDFPIN